jgi:hypothetical protein
MNHTVTIRLPAGYETAEEFAKDCGFDLAEGSEAIMTRAEYVDLAKQVSDTTAVAIREHFEVIPKRRPIDANSPLPVEKRLLLWFIGRNAPKAAHCWTIGTISAHQVGEVWTDGDYKPIEWFSHWMELSPPHPRLP